MSTADLAALADEAAIARLIGRYASVCDWLDWDRLPHLFTPDAAITFGPMFTGDLAAFTPFVTALEEGLDRRIHLMGLPRMDVDGDGARAECACLTHTRKRTDGGSDDGVFIGRYVFDARRTGEGWRFTAMRFYANGVHLAQVPAMDESFLSTADGAGPNHPDKPPVF